MIYRDEAILTPISIWTKGERIILYFHAHYLIGFFSWVN